MDDLSSRKLLSFPALAAALVIQGLLPQSAHGMYDPKHGPWSVGTGMRSIHSRISQTSVLVSQPEPGRFGIWAAE
jgi:hypothetical protein